MTAVARTRRAQQPHEGRAQRAHQKRRSRSRRSVRAPAIDIVVASSQWKSRRHARALLQRAIAAAADAVATTDGEVAVLLTDDQAIRVLNRDWRRKDAATNVLSFPTTPRAVGGKPAKRNAIKRNADKHNVDRRHAKLLGDIVIAYETTEREALAECKPFAHHLAHLAVHGFLHLVGYDHAADVEAQAMEGLETKILARIGVPDPYIAR